MEDFAKMVEIYKWRGPSMQQKETLASSQQNGAGEPSCSGCSELSVERDENHSSPSPSLHHKLGNTGSVQGMEFCAQTMDVPEKALPFAAGRHRSRQRNNLKRKRRAARSRSSRQLVFSCNDPIAEDNIERPVRSEKMTKKNRCNRKKAVSKQDGIGSISQRQACSSVNSHEDSVCEDGPLTTQELNSPYVENSPIQGGTGRTMKGRTRDASMYGKSPYFMPSKRRKKMNGSNPNKERLIRKAKLGTAELKTCTQRQKKEGSQSKGKADRTDVKHLAGQDIEYKDSQERSSSKQLVHSSNLNMASSKAMAGTKKSAYFETTFKPLGQRDIANKTWVPPISVHALIQEELYKDPWKVLVACMLLNKTSGTQMRKIIWDLFDLCPTPEAAVAVETSKIEDVIRRLGLQKKRALMIQKFSKDYLGNDWTNVGQLHGMGKYATDAYAIFCEGRWQEVKPEDHKLVDYWEYLRATDGLGYAFTDDRVKSHEVSMPATSEKF